MKIICNIWLNEQTIYTTGITYTEHDKFTVYCEVYYFPSHLMNTGHKAEKLG